MHSPGGGVTMPAMARPATKSTALWVVRRLRRAGHVALLAGGCVRDMLIGRRTHDYDIATDATPRQVRKLFSCVLLVGAQFGVAVVVHRKQTVEVATFRSDASYSDGRRPDSVTFSSPREDAERRDFTINGMFYDPVARKVIDYVGGRGDLRRRVIRTIGPPDERFAEDYLRMLRAVRLAATLGFEMAPATRRAIGTRADRIRQVSGERVFDELWKMLSLPTAGRALEELATVKLARHLLAELFDRKLWPAAVRRVGAVAKRKDAVLATAALLADLPAGDVSKIIRRWGAPNALRDAVVWTGQHLGDWATAAELALCDFKRLMAHEQFERLRVLWRAAERQATGKIAGSLRIARRAGRIDPAQVAPEPLVTGDDVMAMGLSEGPAVGRILRRIYDAQLNGELTTRRAALAAAVELAARRRH